MNAWRAVGWSGILVAALGCSDSPSATPLPLDVPLAANQVRAGRIDRDAALLTGPNARGRVGDYKLYNDRIAVVISQAGGGLGFHPYGGTIVDADIVRGAGVPGASAFGEIIWSLDFRVMATTAVEVVNDGRDGSEARIRTRGALGPLPLYDALLGGLFGDDVLPIEWTIDYVLEPAADVVRIEHELFASGREDVEATPLVGFFFGTGARPMFPDIGFSSSNSGAGSPYYAAASDDVSYVFAERDAEVSVIFGESGIAVSSVGDVVRLRARERRRHTQQLWIGSGDLARTRAAWRTDTGATLVDRKGRVVDEAGAPVVGAHVHVLDAAARDPDRDYVTRTTSDGGGDFALAVEAGDLQIVATTVDGRISPRTPLAEDVRVVVPATGIARFDVRDDAGDPLPAKIGLVTTTATRTSAPRRFGEPAQGDGLDRIAFGVGAPVEVPLPAGTYDVYVSRGIEYEVFESRIAIDAGETRAVDVVLRRSVDTPGWMTSDPHLHAQRSPDSADAYELKVRALAAENIELPVSTDHEAVGDFGPAIAALGLERWLNGIVGTEITTTRFGHFNAFPMIVDPARPGWGRIDWYGREPAGIFAAAHGVPSSPVLQLNHPRSTTIGYLELIDFDRRTLTAPDDRFSLDFDGIEVINECGDGSLDRAEVLDWFALLSAGHRRFATGTMDDHEARQGRIGVPLTYVGVDATTPGEVTPEAFRAAHAAGRLGVSCGPFVQMRIAGARAGDLVAATTARIDADLKVAAAGWVDVDEVLLIVDGAIRARAPIAEGPGGVRFEGTLSATIAPDRDTWAIAWARGDARHGPWAQGRPSFAFTNAIFVDGDGDGRYAR